MKKIDSWESDFRKRKFYENQSYKKHKELFFKSNSKQPLKSIAVMLDLDDTCDYIDDSKAAYFIRQLDEIRKQVGADYGTISISTHSDSPDSMIDVLDILNRNLTKTIKIGMNFYCGGRFDYANSENIFEPYNFNTRKVDTFVNYCVDCVGVKNRWFAIIDDGIYEETYKTFQNKRPMVVCRPSQRSIDSNTTNFMNLSTTTAGFDGVIEMMSEYINSIASLSFDEILEKQRLMIRHLSSYELVDKIRKMQYEFLVRYFTEGYADDADYEDTLTWLGFTALKGECSKNELDNLRQVLKLLAEKFEKDENQTGINGVKVLEKTYKETE